MSHLFGDLISQHLHRKHGLSQAKLAEGILQDPSIIGKMCKGVHALFLYCDVMGSFRTGKTLFAQAAVELQTDLTNGANQLTLQLLWVQALVRLGVCIGVT